MSIAKFSNSQVEKSRILQLTFQFSRVLFPPGRDFRTGQTGILQWTNVQCKCPVQLPGKSHWTFPMLEVPGFTSNISVYYQKWSENQMLVNPGTSNMGNVNCKCPVQLPGKLHWTFTIETGQKCPLQKSRMSPSAFSTWREQNTTKLKCQLQKYRFSIREFENFAIDISV